MKYLNILLILFLLCGTTIGQQKPMLGELVNWLNVNGGLVAYWPLNEGVGNRVFDLVSGKIGILGAGVSWTAGKYGSAIIGEAEHSGILTNLSSNSWDSGFTIILSITPRTPAGIDYLVDNTDGAVGLMARTSSDYSALDFYTYPGPCKATSTANILVSGVKVVIALVHGPSSNKIYINGILNASDSTNFTLALIDSAADLAILSEYDGTDSLWTDTLDYGYFYNRALSASEMALLYQKSPSAFVKRDYTSFWGSVLGNGNGISIPIMMHYYKLLRR